MRAGPYRSMKLSEGKPGLDHQRSRSASVAQASTSASQCVRFRRDDVGSRARLARFAFWFS